MDLHLRVHLKIMGMLFIVLGIAMVFPAIVGIIYGESETVYSFLAVSFFAIFAGFSVLFFVGDPKERKKFKLRDGLLIVSETWLIASLIGALPFYISGSIPSFVDAFFETASGLSTTGASILSDIEALPKSMLFWRTFTHWIGGMGIIVLAVAILPALGIGGQFIMQAETTGPTLSKVLPKIKDTAKVLYILYFSLTVLETLLLWAGGMSAFDAICHSFATVGTGGFANYNAGLGHFDSAYIDGVVTLFMFICGASFSLHFLAFSKGPKIYFKDSEFKGYFFIVLVITIVLTFYLFSFGTYSQLAESFRYSVFQVVSIVTTTGFATTDYILWPMFAQFLLLLLFFTGACSSSTAGGIKIIRILVMGKFIQRTTALKLHPNHIATIKLDGKPVSNETVSNITSLIMLYFLTLAIGTILVSFDGHDLVTTFTAVASSVGNVGPGFNDVGPMFNYGDFSDFSKIVLSLLMIAGRLEIYTFFMLLSTKFWNPYK